MKKSLFLLAIAGWVFFSSSALSAKSQDVDLSGTWVGSTEVPDYPQPDKLVLVLEKKEGVYQGHFTDEVGYAKETPLRNVVYAENKLSFSFAVFDGTDYQDIQIMLLVEGEKMTGTWANAEGEGSQVILERKK